MKETTRYCDECYADTQQYERRRKKIAEYSCARCGQDLCRDHVHTLAEISFCGACLATDPRLRRAADLITEVEQLIRAAHHAAITQADAPKDAAPCVSVEAGPLGAYPEQPSLLKEGKWQVVPLNDMNWTIRAMKALERGNITTIEELTERTARGLLTLKGLGPTTLREIKERLKIRGLSLKKEKK